MTKKREEQLKKALSIFIMSNRFINDDEQTQNFLEWRDSLEMLNDRELTFLSGLYYGDIKEKIKPDWCRPIWYTFRTTTI